jgi:urea carboxylase-associated protein 2
MSQTISSAFDPASLLWEELVPGGAHWSGVLRRGVTLRLTDTIGGGNVSMLFYNWENKVERYNMADTLKGQHTAFLTVGNVCYSDMGRVICSITGDTCGWHDTICGVSNAASVKARYGEATYQTFRNDYHRNGYDSLVNELGKYGLGKRDLVSNLNLFSKVTINHDGSMQFHAGNSRAGDTVDLRFEMDALVVLSTCQHPLDPHDTYRPRDVALSAWTSGVAGPDDPCRQHCAENQRAFINTERFYA